MRAMGSVWLAFICVYFNIIMTFDKKKIESLFIDLTVSQPPTTKEHASLMTENLLKCKDGLTATAQPSNAWCIKVTQ